MGFTNSSLVSYVRISKNSNPRVGTICRISPHVMAGNLSVETCGNVFANKAASSNYGIGSDGRVAMYVEEKNRSWCTSSKDNDHKAVTIEVANNGGASEGWPISDLAWKSLVELCVDVCRRNGKNKIIWFNDKAKSLSYVPADNEMVLTVHRWFAAKACPGDVLYKRMTELANEVNKAIGTAPAPAPEVSDKDETPVINVTITDDEKYLWDKLGEALTNDFAKAAIFGNLFAESGLVSMNLQNSFEKKLGLTDLQYTSAVDARSYTNFIHDGAGYGLAQWTYYSRKEAMLNYIRSAEGSIGSFRHQADFLVYELSKNYKGLITKLNACKSVKEASNLVLAEYEKPQTVIAGTAQNATAAAKQKLAEVQASRANYSTHFYNIYAVKYKIPYTVRVTCDVLNIRAGAGTNTAKTGKQIKDRGIYTIVEEKTGPGANLWGKLLSGAGWISLDHTQKT